MKTSDCGYGTEWCDCCIDVFESRAEGMTDYHYHEYYEVSLILEGDVKILLKDGIHEHPGPKLVLSSPGTSHMMARSEACIYRRTNLLFSPDFVENYVPEWQRLRMIFGNVGSVIPISAEQAEYLDAQIRKTDVEENSFRKRLMLLVVLSHVYDLYVKRAQRETAAPGYILALLTYIDLNLSKKLTAADLASRVGVGRTTLMTDFKKYTRSTLAEYIKRARLGAAIKMLESGQNQTDVALACGFNDPCNLIRSFKRVLGDTPSRYIRERGRRGTGL